MFSVEPIPNPKSEVPSGPRFLDGAQKHGLIAAGGEEPDSSRLSELLGSFDFAVAADGGYRLLEKLELPCCLLVGDFDTLQAHELLAAQKAGTKLLRFPSDKAKSDLEIAIEEAHKLGATRLSFIGSLGGEWDHCLVNLIAPLSLCHELGIWGRILTSSAEIYLAQTPISVRAPGQRLSLLALSPEVKNLRLQGLEYELSGATLRRSQTMGLANRVNSPLAEISFTQGELLLVLMTAAET